MQDGLKGYTFSTVDKNTLEILRAKLKGILTIREDQIWIDKDRKVLIIFSGIRALSNSDIGSVDCRILVMIANELGGKVEKFSRSLGTEDEYCVALDLPNNDLAGYCASIVIAMNSALNEARLFDAKEIVNNLKVEAGRKAFMAIFGHDNKSTENLKSADMGGKTKIEAK